MRRLDGTDSTDMNLNKLWKTVTDGILACSPWSHESETTEPLNSKIHYRQLPPQTLWSDGALGKVSWFLGLPHPHRELPRDLHA